MKWKRDTQEILFQDLQMIFRLTPVSAYLFNKISSPIKKYSKEYHEKLASANRVVLDLREV